MDGKGGDFGKGPRTTRAAAITENDEKTRARSRGVNVFDGFFGVVAVEAVWVGFSFHPNGNPQISETCCAWKLKVGTSVPPWIKLCVVALQRGYKVRD